MMHPVTVYSFSCGGLSKTHGLEVAASYNAIKFAIRPFGSESTQVISLGLRADGMRACDFLLVISSNLGPNLHSGNTVF